MERETRIEKLREIMAKENIDIYIIPNSDPHQSEYISDYWKSIEYISGFSGSNALLAIGREVSGLWTDSRYFIQAEEDLRGTEIDLFKMGNKGTETLEEWILRQEGKNIGLDGRLFSAKRVEELSETLSKNGKSLDIGCDLISQLWIHRPREVIHTVFPHDIEYAGDSRDYKIDTVRKKMKELGGEAYIIASLDNIGWLYNIRGRDVECNPVVNSYALISKERAELYVDTRKITETVRLELEKSGIEIYNYSLIEDRLEKLDFKSICLDKEKLNSYIYQKISDEVEKIFKKDIVENIKCVKNNVEIRNHKRAQIKDSIAMTKFMFWLENTVRERPTTELEVVEKLEDFRRRAGTYIEPSFHTIAAYKDHGAIVHYSPKEDTNYEINREGLLLIDSGGQYLEGTTDITRTISLGRVTSEQKLDYTLVLKGHIGLSETVFPKGTTGCKIDAIARLALWSYGKNYGHGTGHGIGNLLSVHEGPQTISPRCNGVDLKEGMLITNEPGYYREGEYGIRLENILLVKVQGQRGYEDYLGFENMTYCIFDLNLVDEELLDEGEKHWINSYHRDVYERMSPYLEDDERFWLKRKTRWI